MHPSGIDCQHLVNVRFLKVPAEGRFGVVDIAAVDGLGDEESLTLTAAVKGGSDTIPRGIRGAAEERGLSYPRPLASTAPKIRACALVATVRLCTWAVGYYIVALPLAVGMPAPLGILPSPAVGAMLMSPTTVMVAVHA
jgi:hypothetical protein